MWVIYNKIDGKIASVIHQPKEGFLLKDTNYDWMDWDTVFMDDFPDHIDAKDCRIINGNIVILEPESVVVYVSGRKPDENGIYHASPGEKLKLVATFLNSYKKPMKRSGDINWKHDRGLLEPRQETIKDKKSAYATITLPNENITVMIRCAFDLLEPVYIKIEIS